MGDYQAQGRTIGNLGNTHYLLGNYKKSIRYHEEVSHAQPAVQQCSGLSVVS